MAMGGDGGSPPANDNSRLQGGSEAASAGAARLQAPLRAARRPIVKTATAAALPVGRLRGGGGQLRQLAR
ncbi:hypothetical protein [Sphingobium sp. LB126]|uniref:hypothetical protein n=1 Tax=Sphingobium sp. LB126 TaxID=1983755 RepID=UPI001F5BEEE2|nr:hypothetical protein [Sphingobium sp. LB126]